MGRPPPRRPEPPRRPAGSADYRRDTPRISNLIGSDERPAAGGGVWRVGRARRGQSRYDEPAPTSIPIIASYVKRMQGGRPPILGHRPLVGNGLRRVKLGGGAAQGVGQGAGATGPTSRLAARSNWSQQGAGGGGVQVAAGGQAQAAIGIFQHAPPGVAQRATGRSVPGGGRGPGRRAAPGGGPGWGAARRRARGPAPAPAPRRATGPVPAPSGRG